MDGTLRNSLAGLLLTALSFAVVAAPATEPLPQDYGVFEEPLVAFDAPDEAGRQALAAAISAYRTAGDPARVEALADYLERSPTSPWRASLLINMALARQRAGFFSEAITLLEQARLAAAGADTLAEQQVEAKALGELLSLHTRFGHRDRLKDLIETIEDSPASASISELVTEARSALWQMLHEPEQALRCGIVALEDLLGAVNGIPGAARSLEGVPAGDDGTSLARLVGLARSHGLSVDAVRRDANQPVPVPSVVHWRVGHFAAILDEMDGRYQVVDPALGGEMWVSGEALAAESSGYFLALRSDSEPMAWAVVDDKVAEGVIGSGYTSSSQPNQTSDCDKKECGDSCQEDPTPTSSPYTPSDPQPVGMPYYRVHSMLVSLNIRDTPVSHTPPIGPAVPVTVTYSQREANQPTTFNFFNFGHKWAFNWLSYVQDDPQSPGNQVMIYLPGGGSRDYGGYDASTGSFAPEQRTGAQLVRASSSPLRYERRMPDGSLYVYAQSDEAAYYPRRVFLTEKVDKAGNAVSLQYDAQQRLITITDALGQATTLGYEDPDYPLRVTGASDPFGRTAHFVYDDSGRLISITDAIGLTSTFQYNSGTFINAMTTPYGTTRFAYGESGTTRWLEITDPKGEKERVEFRHGAPGIPFSESPVPSGMNVFNRYINGRNTFYWDKEAMKRAPGDYTKARIRHWYHLRINGRLTTGVLESIKEPLERRVWYSYPGQNWAGAEGTLDKPSHIGRVLPDGSTQLTRHSYNGIGNVTRTVDPQGREWLYEYAANQIDLVRIKRKSASGYDVLAEYTYDDAHRPLTYTGPAGQVTEYSYNDAGQVIRIVNALGHTTRFEYDDQSYLIAEIDPNGNVRVRYTYDEAGRIASSTDATGYTLSYSYDALDRLVRTTYPDGTHMDISYDRLDVASVTDRHGNTTSYAYDALRNKIGVTDPSGHFTQYGHFANGQPQSMTDGRGNTTQWQRDLQGRITQASRADGSQSSYSYDNAGRSTRVTDALGGHTDYGYAHDDRLASVTDPNGNTTSYGYDSYSGQQIAQDSPDTGHTAYVYDLAGNLISRTDAKGQTTTFQYDVLNRITRAEYADGQLVEYIYDSAPNGIGRIAEIRESSGVTAYEYDVNGRIVTLAQTDPNGNALVTRYAYTDAGLPARITYPSGAVVVYAYVKDRLAGIEVNGQTVLDGVKYAPFGPPSGWNRANGLTDTRRYDAAGDLDQYSVAGGLREIAYDPVGNIITINDDSGLLAQNYAYDSLERLTEARSNAFDLAYAYDANGNRTLVSDASLEHSYSTQPGSNRLVAVDEQARVYDANGNTLNDSRHQYGYDARDRLTSVDQGATGEYRYNALGQRLYKRSHQAFQLTADLNGDGQVTAEDILELHSYVRHKPSPVQGDLNQDGNVDNRDTACIATSISRGNGNNANLPPDCKLGEWVEISTETRFVYDGHRLLGEYGADGSVRQELIWMGDMPVAVLDQGGLYQIHTNHLNAPLALTDQQGQVVWRWEPRPFADTMADEDPDGDGERIGFNLRYPGQYFDGETGLNYNYFRDYDPSAGRYTQSDPIGLAGGLNTYLFSRSNPLRYADPLGLYPGEEYVDYLGDAIGGAGDFLDNYGDMRDANTIGGDKYFHCKANCEAAQRGEGGEDMACTISDAREWVDENIKGDPPSASAADQIANHFGRTNGSANSNIDCRQICVPFRPTGLDPKY